MGTSGLGALLVEEGLLTEIDRRTIKRTCGTHGSAFARAVIALGLLDEDELAAFLAERTRWRVTGKDLARESSREAIGALDPPLIQRLEVLPLRITGQTLHIAMVDPLDHDTIKQVEFFTGYKVQPHIATFSQIRNGLERSLKGYKPQPSHLEDLITNHALAASRRLRIVDQAAAGGATAAKKSAKRHVPVVEEIDHSDASAYLDDSEDLAGVSSDPSADLEYPDSIAAAEGAKAGASAASDSALDDDDFGIAELPESSPDSSAAVAEESTLAALADDPSMGANELDEGDGIDDDKAKNVAHLEGLDDLESMGDEELGITNSGNDDDLGGLDDMAGLDDDAASTATDPETSDSLDLTADDASLTAGSDDEGSGLDDLLGDDSTAAIAADLDPPTPVKSAGSVGRNAAAVDDLDAIVDTSGALDDLLGGDDADVSAAPDLGDLEDVVGDEAKTVAAPASDDTDDLLSDDDIKGDAAASDALDNTLGNRAGDETLNSLSDLDSASSDDGKLDELGASLASDNQGPQIDDLDGDISASLTKPAAGDREDDLALNDRLLDEGPATLLGDFDSTPNASTDDLFGESAPPAMDEFVGDELGAASAPETLSMDEILAASSDLNADAGSTSATLDDMLEVPDDLAVSPLASDALLDDFPGADDALTLAATDNATMDNSGSSEHLAAAPSEDDLMIDDDLNAPLASDPSLLGERDAALTASTNDLFGENAEPSLDDLPMPTAATGPEDLFGNEGAQDINAMLGDAPLDSLAADASLDGLSVDDTLDDLTAEPMSADAAAARVTELAESDDALDDLLSGAPPKSTPAAPKPAAPAIVARPKLAPAPAALADDLDDDLFGEPLPDLPGAAAALSMATGPIIDPLGDDLGDDSDADLLADLGGAVPAKASMPAPVPQKQPLSLVENAPEADELLMDDEPDDLGMDDQESAATPLEAHLGDATAAENSDDFANLDDLGDLGDLDDLGDFGAIPDDELGADLVAVSSGKTALAIGDDMDALEESLGDDLSLVANLDLTATVVEPVGTDVVVEAAESDALVANLNRSLLTLTLAKDFADAVRRVAPVLTRAGLSAALLLEQDGKQAKPLLVWEGSADGTAKIADQNLYGYAPQALIAGLSRYAEVWQPAFDAARVADFKALAAWSQGGRKLMALAQPAPGGKRLIIIAAWNPALVAAASVQGAAASVLRRLAQFVRS